MRYPRTRVALTVSAVLAVATTILLAGSAGSAAAAPQYDITTLAGKVASLNGTAGLQIRFSAFLEEEAEDDAPPRRSRRPITPTFVPRSPLDGNTILPPDVTVNQDTAGAPQNETAIAVDPNNPNRVVGRRERLRHPHVDAARSAGRRAARSATATPARTSRTTAAQTWCCTSTDPEHLGTLIPGVDAPHGRPVRRGRRPVGRVRQPGPRLLRRPRLQPHAARRTPSP